MSCVCPMSLSSFIVEAKSHQDRGLRPSAAAQRGGSRAGPQVTPWCGRDPQPPRAPLWAGVPGRGTGLKAGGCFCQILLLLGKVRTTNTRLACLQKPCRGPWVLGAGRLASWRAIHSSLWGPGTGGEPWVLCCTQFLRVTALS